MGMVVQHNMNALNAYNKLNTNVAGLKKSSEKLSSGYRINRAGDDAAGLAISEKMRSQIRGLTQAKRNSQDGISMIQTFEGATNESHSILQRMKELASESANGTYQDEVDRDAIQLEFNQLNDELDQIADTDFNGVVMLNGGQMADGVKATNGKFDYVNATRDAQQIGTAGGYIKGVDVGAYAGTNKESVTFTYTQKDDGTFEWKNSADAIQQVTSNANGGFTYDGAVFAVDTSKLVNGDTIVVDFEKASVAVGKGPVTTGYNIDGSDTGVVTLDKNPLAAAAEDGVITSEKIAEAANALNGLTLTYTATKGDTALTLATVNGKKPNAAQDVEIAKLGENESIVLDKDGKTLNYIKKGSTAVKIGELQDVNAAAAAVNAAAAAAKDGTVTVTVNLADASYTPAKSNSVSVVEPKAKVSEANSNKTATAPLTYSDHMVLQTGSRTKDSVDFTFKYTTDGMGDLKSNLDLSSRANGLNTKNLSLSTQEDANNAIDKIDNAINKVSMVRATFGATQNRLEHKIENLTTNTENLTEAESTIRDTDMASEMLNYTKFNVLQQAAQSMLAQANQQPQSILQLLG